MDIEIDMVAMTNFGRKMSKHFLGCEPQECIDQINEVLDSYGLCPLDYNFLIGIRYEIEKRI